MKFENELVFDLFFILDWSWRIPALKQHKPNQTKQRDQYWWTRPTGWRSAVQSKTDIDLELHRTLR